MQIEELRYVCLEAAVDLVGTGTRPVVPTVVLPGPDRTQLVSLPEFPEDDEARHALLASFAEERITADQRPAWGFIAEAEVAGVDAVVVVYGARRHVPQITAAAFASDGELIEFEGSEQLDPTAMPFLHPLQHAVDALPALEQPPGPESDGLPLFGD